MQIDVTVQDANNILCEVTPPQPQIIVIDRGVEGNGIVSIVPVTISTFQYLRITYTNGTVQDVGPLTSTAYTATAPITIVGNTISLATVPIASGGTDATTAAGAIQNLLPSYTGNANKRLGLNSTATALEWVLDGGGTVTSVAASGGTTGLTFTGSPITTSGTLTLGGTLAIANGGTGQTTANAALNALLPTQTGNASKYLQTDGTNATWDAISLSTADITGTLGTANGGTGLGGSTPFTANGVVYASSTSALTTGSALTFDGSRLLLGTTSPQGKFTIDAGGAAGLYLTSATGGAVVDDFKLVRTAGSGGSIVGSNTWVQLYNLTDNNGSGFQTYQGGTIFWGNSSGTWAEQMRLVTGGKLAVNPVGGGTGVKLNITGGGSGALGAVLIGDGDVSGSTNYWNIGRDNTTSGAFTFAVNGSEKIRINTSGEFLVGCTGLTGDAPNALGSTYQQDNGNTKIRVAADLQAAFQFYSVSGGTTAPVGNIAVGSSSVSYFTSAGNSGFVGLDANTLGFVTSGFERARIDSSGNFGLGTSSPSGASGLTFAINGGGNQTRIALKNSNTGDASGDGFQIVLDSGGLDVGFEQRENASIRFSTNNVEALRILNNQNVGIGTSSPSEKLQVNGKAIIGSYASTGAYGLYLRSDASSAHYNWQISTQNVIDGGFEIARSSATGGATFNSPSLVIDAAGRVIIGTTTSAGAKLTVAGNLGTSIGNNPSGIRMTNTDTGNYASISAGLVGLDNAGMDFSVDGTRRMVIDGSGNLLVGSTSNPNTNKAFFYGNGGTVVRVGDGTNSSWRGYVIGATSGDSSEYAFLKLNASSGELQLYVGPSTYGGYQTFYTNGSERARISTTGNFGLGTSAPAFKLDTALNGAVISGTATIGSNMNGMRLYNATSATANNAVGLWFNTGPHQAGIASFRPTPDTDWSTAIAFYTHGGATSGLNDCYERMRVDGEGNLLINQPVFGFTNNNSIAIGPNSSEQSIIFNHYTGTASGTGYAKFAYAGSQIGSITQNGTTAVAYNTSSDYRLKNTIAPMMGALAKVALLKPCTYKWNADGSDGEGFIAHELAEVCPHAVTGEKDAVNEDGSIKPQAIDTSFLVATLTAAIQELKAEFDAYKASHP